MTISVELYNNSDELIDSKRISATHCFSDTVSIYGQRCRTAVSRVLLTFICSDCAISSKHTFEFRGYKLRYCKSDDLVTKYSREVYHSGDCCRECIVAKAGEHED
nr:MAG: hypothetical protein P1 [Sobemovirus sp.]